LKAYPEAIRIAKKLPDSPPKMLAMLYDAPPAGFISARDIGERLLKDPKYTESASIHAWLAAAYGQEYTYELNQGHMDKLPGIERKIESLVAASVDLDPATRPLLLSFWRPAAGSTDNDLKDIPQNNAVLTTVLTPGSLEAHQGGSSTNE